MSTTKKIAKNFSWLISGELINRLFGLIMLIYIARVMGSEAFGWISFAQAFLAYLVLFVDLGFPVFGIREIAKAKDRASVISLNIFLFRFVLSTIIFLVSAVIVCAIHIPFEIKLLFVGTFLYVFFRAFEPYWVYQGLEKMEYAGIMRVLQSGLCLVLVLIFVRSISDLVKIPFILFTGGMMVNFVFLFILYKYFASLKLSYLIPQEWGSYYIGAIPLGISALLMQVYYNLDTIMLGFIGTQEKVGLYNAAYKLYFGLLLWLGVWNSTVFPIVSRLFADDQAQALKFIHKYQRLTFLLCIPIAFFITFASPIIVQVLFGISYLPSAIALQILIWNMVVVSISGTYWMLILVPLGRTKEVMYAVASGALTNIILNILLIPPFSFVGAAAATLITEIVVAVIMSFFALREVKVGLLGFIVKPLIGGALSFLLALLSLYYLVDVNIIYRYMIASLLFTVSYLLFILLSGEWRIIKQFIGEIFA